MIIYQNDLAGINPAMLQGFFVGWPNPPSPETHYRILQGSQHLVLALDDQVQRVVGFINALSDGILSAYIPLLEVLPDYQKQGIGLELTQRMLTQLQHLYAIDLLCDPELQAFYTKVGMRPATGMMVRNYENQSGG
jgi:ribosomal protein S18 acetylase RimI-like enzyme